MDHKIINHVSGDTETWGKRAGCDLRSIGAVLFDPLSGTIVDEFYTACSNPVIGNRILDQPIPDHYSQQDIDKIPGYFRVYKLERDPDTVDWWYRETTEEARKAFDDAIDLKEALQLFSDWLIKIGANKSDEYSLRLWGHGASFDVPILEAAYYAVDLPVPWHYRAPRDTRTLFDDAQITNHSEYMKQFRKGVFHHAYWDAFNQSQAIAGAQMRIADAFAALDGMTKKS